MTRLVEWCDVKDHAGVKGKARSHNIASGMCHVVYHAGNFHLHHLYYTMHYKLILSCKMKLNNALFLGEANRLVAWLVKHSRTTPVMRMVVEKGSIPHLVNMANAEHAVMQNEALIALTLIATSVIGQFNAILPFFIW